MPNLKSIGTKSKSVNIFVLKTQNAILRVQLWNSVHIEFITFWMRVNFIFLWFLHFHHFFLIISLIPLYFWIIFWNYPFLSQKIEGALVKNRFLMDLHSESRKIKIYAHLEYDKLHVYRVWSLKSQNCALGFQKKTVDEMDFVPMDFRFVITFHNNPMISIDFAYKMIDLLCVFEEL